ncbi:DUF4436 family protein [Kitasatospora purpeofusca]|uniref:DUF4436 family protein n=1 Tax=Kitasatospora purpeofusca TaxID=67352 RepID=UPI002259C723|nr:DUF4436 family protein [Kitasatospora purpeofusca]MCX4756157.1 DUF4436 domain-containing protein [Kitasatospora purpeofusca]WSR36010.1 DUF4436 domain-containing protein [Kitasatospora purpeofusca]WSR44301.1 DUF4436 domain-containing protein [Kitasatospora purpeofusca]
MSGRRLRDRRFLLVLLILAVLCSAGIALYLNERNTRQQTRELSLPSTGDWVELDVTSQDIDAAGGEMTLYVVPVPHGTLAQDPESGTFTRRVDITVRATTRTELRADPGEAATPKPVSANLYDGTPTDYPFDRYRFEVLFSAADATGAVPVGVVFGDADPFFVVRPTGTPYGAEGTVFEGRVSRARSTFILAWFMIAAMWALALAVLAGAEVLYRGRQGMVWPSLGWMAATLFALIGMRNAAPGTPPIGSLIDYVAFFWAEGIIAACLVVTVVSGSRVEHRKRVDADGPTAGAGP